MRSARLRETLAQAFDGMADDERASELYMAGTSRRASTHGGRPGPAVRRVGGAGGAHEVDELAERNHAIRRRRSGDRFRKRTRPVCARLSGNQWLRAYLRGRHGRRDGMRPHHHRRKIKAVMIRSRRANRVFVGSIGPTHMDYAATMAAVRAVARYLTAFSPTMKVSRPTDPCLMRHNDTQNQQEERIT